MSLVLNTDIRFDHLIDRITTIAITIIVIKIKTTTTTTTTTITKTTTTIMTSFRVGDINLHRSH